MKKNFFTKKSVALIFAAVIMVGFFCVNFANARETRETCTPKVGETTCTSITGNTCTIDSKGGTICVSPTQAPTAPYKPNCYMNPATDPTLAKTLVCTSSHGKTYTYLGYGMWSSPSNTSKNPAYDKEVFFNSVTNPSGQTPDSVSALETKAEDAMVAAENALLNPTPEKSLADYVGEAIGNAFTFGAKTVGNIVGQVISYLLEFVTIPISSFFLSISGIILDYSVQYTIYGDGFHAMTGSIQGVWVLVRDTANLFFIFMLLYLAIQQIIFGSFKKEVLTSIIISAVLINFSLFLTNIVIDASNMAATSLYNQITLSASSTPSGAINNLVKGIGSGAIGAASTIDLSGKVMDGLGLVTIFDINNDRTNKANTDLTKTLSGITGVGAFITSFFKLIMFLITTFVFLALAGLLIGRFIMLVLLMATAPIGFLGSEVVPGIGEYAQKWRTTLTNECLVAPIFMFFMLLTIRLSQVLVATKETNPMILFFNFYLVAWLLLKTVSITKKFSGPLGDYFTKIASMATGAALTYTTGGTAAIMRQTIGRGASEVSNSAWGTRLEALSHVGGAWGGLAKMANTGIKKTASSTFDMKNTGLYKTTLSDAEGISGMSIVDRSYVKASGDYGASGKGYVGYQKQTIKDAEKEAKDAEKAAKEAGEDIVDRNPELVQEYEARKKKEVNNSQQEITNGEGKIKQLDKEIEDLKKQPATPLTTAAIKTKEQEKKAAQVVVTEATKTKTAAEESLKNVKKGMVADFTAAESAIRSFQEKEKELKVKEKKLLDEVQKAQNDPTTQALIAKEKQLADKLKFGSATMTIGEIAQTTQDREKLRGEIEKLTGKSSSELKAVQDDIKNKTEEYKKAKDLFAQTKNVSVKQMSAIRELNEVRKDIAQRFRNRASLLNPLRSEADSENIASKIGDVDIKKEAEKEERRLKAEAEVEAQKKYERENPGQTKP